MTEPAQSKIDRERAFHNEVFADRSRADLWKYYEVTKASADRYAQLLQRQSAPCRVLEYGCGAYTDALELASIGCELTGIDISEEAIALSEKAAADRGVSDRTTYLQMDAEKPDFPDATFDLICGSSVIHHLDLHLALPAVARMLKPGGRAVFSEPMGHNPAINAYRRRTPEMRTEDEHPLLRSDLRLTEKYFGRQTFEFFELATLLAVPARRSSRFRPLLSTLQRIDRVILADWSPLRAWGWRVVIELVEPTPAG